MASGSYYVNPAVAAHDLLWTALKLMSSAGKDGAVSPVTLYQDPEDGRWVCAANGQEFKDLSLSRVIERAGRSLTTVYDR